MCSLLPNCRDEGSCEAVFKEVLIHCLSPVSQCNFRAGVSLNSHSFKLYKLISSFNISVLS